MAITTVTADSSALNYASLLRKGQPIPSNDLWIAASALEHSAALLTQDVLFAHAEGMRVGNWKTFCLERIGECVTQVIKAVAAHPRLLALGAPRQLRQPVGHKIYEMARIDRRSREQEKLCAG